jgi:hypothetical protein
VIFLFYRVYEVRRKRVLQSALQTLGVLGKYITTHSWVPFTWRTFCVYTLFILTNAIVVGGVNAAYVYVAIYGSSSVLFVSQLALSCFKLFWNRFFSIYLIRWTTRWFDGDGINDVVRMQTSLDSSQSLPSVESAAAEFASLQVLVALLNNIAIPCLIVAVVSPSCFYNVFVAPPQVNTQYNFRSCGLVYDGKCVGFDSTPVYISYDPPFAYSYQCSSSIITYYGPAFVILCIVRTFATPALQLCLFGLYVDATAGTWWQKTLLGVVPRIMRPIAAKLTLSDEKEAPKIHIYQPYLDANQLILSMITYCGILMTFGVVFPPVAVAIVVTMGSVLYYTKLKTGRFICCALDIDRLDLLRVLEEESKQAGFFSVVERALWMVITTSCLFYTLFLFDTLGDSVGFSGAYWVLIVMPLLPLGLYLGYLLSAMILRGLCSRVHSVDANHCATDDGKLPAGVSTVNVLHTSNGQPVNDTNITEDRSTFEMTHVVSSQKKI